MLRPSIVENVHSTSYVAINFGGAEKCAMPFRVSLISNQMLKARERKKKQNFTE